MRLAVIFLTGRCGFSSRQGVNLPLETTHATVLTRRPISLAGEIRGRDFDGGTVSEWGKPGEPPGFSLFGVGFGRRRFLPPPNGEANDGQQHSNYE
jgi:hypothetical protein